MALHKSHAERSHDADVLLQHNSRSSSGRQSSDKQDAVEDFVAFGQHEAEEERGRNTDGEEDSDSNPLKRQRDAHGSGDGKDDQDDTEYRRMRRRITNRESAKRMRIKRQEELATFQREVISFCSGSCLSTLRIWIGSWDDGKQCIDNGSGKPKTIKLQLKRVTSENEHLRRFSAHLQKQHIILATDVQHWQTKFNAANAEIGAIFQQLQQVVAISAAFNPAILEAVGKSNATVSPAQAPVLEALTEALPQARMLAELMEALRKSGQTGSIASALAPLIPSAPGAQELPAAGARPAAGPLGLPTSGILSAANLTAIRLAAAAHAETRGAASIPPGARTSATGLPSPQQLLAPKPVRPGQAAAAPGQDAKSAGELQQAPPSAEGRAADQLPASAAVDYAGFDLDAMLRATHPTASTPG